MKLFCPICFLCWEWDGQPVEITLEDSGKTLTYMPKPTRLGRCTCPECNKKPVPPHIPPNAGGTTGVEDSPWQENAIRILEDGQEEKCPS